MTEDSFRPNWASAPGETIQAIVNAHGFSTTYLQQSLSIQEIELVNLLAGTSQISSELAKRLSNVLGSTPRFWLERDKQYQASLRAIELESPELAKWTQTFPVNEMVKAGWLTKPSSTEIAAELLEYFGVSNLDEWRSNYLARLQGTKFRTSQSLANSIGSTTAWIRHGELVAERLSCGVFNKGTFSECLLQIKQLTSEANPSNFIPALQNECAKHGVAVVVARAVPGCAASGATLLLETGAALLLLSARFLSDDQFWFSFFHEAGHLLLHTHMPCVEEPGADANEIEDEANSFAQKIILSPAGEEELMAVPLNRFSIARFARRCGVSPGLIVGQLQHRGKIGRSAYGAFKIRYSAKEFTLENQRG